MIQDTNLGKYVFIQKQPDNQLVTEFKEVFADLYDNIENAFAHNVSSKSEGATEEEMLALHVQYDYILKSLENIKDAFVNLETGLTC